MHSLCCSFCQVPHSWPPSACVHQQGPITRVESGPSAKSSEKSAHKKSLADRDREGQNTLTPIGRSSSSFSSTFAVSSIGKRGALTRSCSGEIEQYVLGREFGIQYTLLVYSAARPDEQPSEAATVAFRIRKLLCREASASSDSGSLCGSCADPADADWNWKDAIPSGSSATDALLRQQLLDALGIITPTPSCPPRADLQLQPQALPADSNSDLISKAPFKPDARAHPTHRPTRPVSLAGTVAQPQPQPELVSELSLLPVSNSDPRLNSSRGSTSGAAEELHQRHDSLPSAYLVQCFGAGNELRVRAQLDKKVRVPFCSSADVCQMPMVVEIRRSRAAADV